MAIWSMPTGKLARAGYNYLNLDDPTAAIAWPAPREDWIVSNADMRHPMLGEVTPIQL